MAKYLGADITATASDENRDFVLGLGADRVIDYKKIKFEEEVRDMDWVFDGIGGDYIDRSLKVLKPGGTIVSLPSGASQQVGEKAKAAGKFGFNFMVKSNGNNMQEIAGLLGQGKIKSYVTAIFAFDDIRSAHRQIETGRTKGKLVVTLD